MGKKIYNPDKVEVSDNTNDKKTATNKENKKNRFGGFFGIFTDSRTRRVIGMTLCLIGAYLLLIFISYFSTGEADQSVVISYGMEEFANTSSKVKNIGSIFGANLANEIIKNGIGIAAFIAVLWAFVIGWRLLALKKVHFFSYTSISIVGIIACSMIVEALTYDQNLTFFPLGGEFGKYINNQIMILAGFPAVIVANVFIAGLWIFLCLNTIKNWYGKVKTIIPKRTHFDGNDVANDDDSIVKKETKQSNNKKETEVLPEQPKEDDVDPFDVQKPLEHESEQEEKEVDDLGKIEIAPEIVQAKTTTVEAFDPTKELSKYKFPTIDLLKDRAVNHANVDIDEQEENKKRITETLNNYNIPIKKIDVCVGPTITLFEIVPADGVRIAKIKNLENDIALSLAALGIRIIAPIPGKGTIGIEVPNKEPQTVSMRSVIGSKKFQESKMELPMAMGCTIENKVYIADLAKMPHLLVAGATGQGKSVGLNAIITSLLYKKHPAELKFVLIDPKMVEFSLYSKLEHHYLARVAGGDECIITEPKKVITTLNSLVQEMENRYMLLRDAQERNIKDYNKKFIDRRLNPEKGHHFLPYIVVIVDEFSDLIMVSGKEVERPIVRIAQKARAVGIHMIIATQRPSTNVITGIIKANFPGRIAFRVSQMVDSRTILDCSGAQQLVGKGDMLFQSGGMTDRVQCAFVDTPEVEAICSYIGEQIGYSEPYELPEFVGEVDDEGGTHSGVNLNDRDTLFEDAAAFIVSSETASTSSLQRRYRIGYNRAGNIMDQLEAAGIVGPAQGGKPRRVLVDSIQLATILEQNK